MRSLLGNVWKTAKSHFAIECVLCEDCLMSHQPISRRQFSAVMLSTAVVAAAGCLHEDDEAGPPGYDESQDDHEQADDPYDDD